MKIPEWEIRDAVCWNPDLLDTSYDLELVDFQVPVKKGNQEKYIDILFNIKDNTEKNYLILELKKQTATESAVEQVLEYKDWFCTRKYQKENEVVAMVAAPNIIPAVKKKEVKYSEIDTEQVHETHPREETDKEQLAKKLRETSQQNPLFAHELIKGRNPQEFNEERAWLWLFYSILDGGGPAQTFIKAYRSMKREEIHKPRQLNQLIEEHGEENAARKLLPHLRKATLFNPGKGGVINYGKAILKAAELLKEHGYSFKELHRENKELKDIKETLGNIPYMKSNDSRRKKQFIRGMVLRGNWNYPRDNEYFFEKPKQSTHIMNVSRRLGLNNHRELKEFTENQLEDYMVLSHSLWVLGKKHCSTSTKPECIRCKARKPCPSSESFKAKPMPNVGLDKWMN